MHTASSLLLSDEPALPLSGVGLYESPKNIKMPALLETLNALTQWHRERCLPYAHMMERLFPQCVARHLHEVPYLPVRLFKMLELSSVRKEQVIKTLTSSGTTGKDVSRIFLDRETALRQSRALSAIMATFLGKRRWPMVVVDSADLLQDRRQFSARVAAILGFSLYGRDHFHCLESNLNLDVKALQAYLDRYADTPVFIFGFTFLIWQGLYKSALRQGVRLRFPSGSMIIHGGGWKRLADQQVDNLTFKQCLQEQFGVEHIHNYYGMVEQVGSIFMECEYGHLHSPNFADIVVRDPQTMEILTPGQPGVLQVFSCLPLSYPGHSLLTEDIGILHGVDDCSCGRAGSYFSVKGRLAQVDLRGCSDTRLML